MSAKVVILLTATVDPNGMIYTKLNNPHVREQQYIKAILRWEKISKIVPIVFIENSGYEVNLFRSKLKNSENPNFYFVGFNGNDYDRNLGKGYGELLCIEHGLKMCKLISPNSIVIKATGRYFVRNILSYVDYVNSNLQFDLFIDFNKNLTYSDSRIFAFKHDFFHNFLFKYINVICDKSGIIFENVLSKAALEYILENKKICILNDHPRISGKSGTFNENYHDSLISWLPRDIRQKIKKYFFGY
ncbi:MAG: hypothetical protein ACKVOU_01385 [Cytophagales bacterium]